MMFSRHCFHDNRAFSCRQKQKSLRIVVKGLVLTSGRKNETAIKKSRSIAIHGKNFIIGHGGCCYGQILGTSCSESSETFES